MLELVITGGQTGPDQAGWRAARAAGIPTGGAMPLGFLNEDGARPEFAGLYGAHRLDVADYPARTEANARASCGTLWFGSPHTAGYRCTNNATWMANKPILCVIGEGIGPSVRPSEIAKWIAFNKIRVLNVAGNRESKAPGIRLRTERFLVTVFKMVSKVSTWGEGP